MSDFESPSVKRALNTLSESIFVVALVMVLLLISLGTLSRFNRLADVAPYLPAETEALVVVNMKEYVQESHALLTDFYGQDLRSLKWFNRDVALAWVNGEMIRFVETSSRSQAEKFMESLRVEGETFLDDQDFKCYSMSQPDCFTFAGKFLVLGSPDALAQLGSGLENTLSYQNVRHRLPYDVSLFAYVDMQSVRQAFLTSLGDLSVEEPGYLESVLRLFPAYGVSVDMKGDEWKSESFVAVNKSQLDEAAFFHPKTKFSGDLLAMLPGGSAFEWSGVDSWSLVSEMHEHLKTLNPAAALVFQEKINSLWSQYFGSASLEEYGVLFNREQAVTWDPEAGFVWMMKLKEADQEVALNLKDFFIEAYPASTPQIAANGEQIAIPASLSANWETYQGDDYIQMGPEGETTHYLAILDDVIVFSDQEAAFFEVMDRWRGRADTRDTSESMPMLLGTDFYTRLDMTGLAESHIINLLLPKVQEWTSTAKLFDDGIYIRSHLNY